MMKVDVRDRAKDRADRWFRRGVSLARDGRTKDAARAFGMSHHADFRLENAALLTFACLKAKEGHQADLVEQLIQSWQESGSPPVTRTRADRSLMASLDDGDERTRELSPLGRLAWTVLGPTGRDHLCKRLRGPESDAIACLIRRDESSDSRA